MRSSAAGSERGLEALAVAGLSGVATFALLAEDTELASALEVEAEDEADGVGEAATRGAFVLLRFRGMMASSSADVSGALPPSLPLRSLHDVERCFLRTSGRAKDLPHAGQMQLGELSAFRQRPIREPRLCIHDEVRVVRGVRRVRMRVRRGMRQRGVRGQECCSGGNDRQAAAGPRGEMLGAPFIKLQALAPSPPGLAMPRLDAYDRWCPRAVPYGACAADAENRAQQRRAARSEQ